MAWNGNVFFGFNDNGYVAEWNTGMLLSISSVYTDDANSTLERMKEIANEYAKKLVREEGYDMPYAWNWGDIVNEIPDEVFAEMGIVYKCENVTCRYHDEEVVPEMWHN